MDQSERRLRLQIASSDPDPAILCSLAAVCGRKADFAELKELVKQALALDPHCAEAHNHLGNALQAEGRLDEALTCFQQALACSPQYVSALVNLGNLWRELGDFDAAIDSLQAALQLDPQSVEACNNYGLALQEKGDLESAIAEYRKALMLDPDFTLAHYNLGNALRDQGDFLAAADCYADALCLQPNYAEAAFNLSRMLLLLGHYQQGWNCYEYRFQLQKGPVYVSAAPDIPLWPGGSLNRGDRLLVVAEQGLGDCLQFVRYVLPLARQGVDVSFCPPPALRGLLAASGVAASLLTPAQAQAVTDGCWIPLLSLPKHLAVAPDNPIITEPYLRTTRAHLQRWRQVLAGERRPLIALNWQGNPQAETTTLRGRSLPLESFAVVAECTQATFLSLQKGHGSEQLENCSFRHRFAAGQELVSGAMDFLDSAAILSQCDLVITSDTAVAHLAAAMGQQTWLLLHDAPDWRWGLESETSFWYPSLRLFRQRRAGDWSEVMERVARELEALESLSALLGSGGGAQAAAPTSTPWRSSD